jgi:hypothetical protein
VGASEIFSIGVDTSGEVHVHFKFAASGSTVYRTGVKTCLGWQYLVVNY